MNLFENFFYVGNFKMGYYLLSAEFRAIPDSSCCGVSWAKHIRDGNLARGEKYQNNISMRENQLKTKFMHAK